MFEFGIRACHGGSGYGVHLHLQLEINCFYKNYAAVLFAPINLYLLDNKNRLESVIKEQS